MKKCIICNSGNMDQRLEAHHLCLARERHGLTVVRRNSCLVCHGTGFNESKRSKAIGALSGVLNPSGHTLETIDRVCICLECNGKG